MGCGAKELGIFGDAAGVWNFLVAFREASWNFPRQDHDFKEFRGFPGMELGIFRAAKSSGEGRTTGVGFGMRLSRAIVALLLSRVSPDSGLTPLVFCIIRARQRMLPRQFFEKVLSA